MVNQKIISILSEIRARDYPETKKLLEKLDEDLEELEKLQEFFNKIDKLCKGLKKSDIVNKEKIEKLLKEYKK